MRLLPCLLLQILIKGKLYRHMREAQETGPQSLVEGSKALLFVDQPHHLCGRHVWRDERVGMQGQGLDARAAYPEGIRDDVSHGACGDGAEHVRQSGGQLRVLLGQVDLHIVVYGPVDGPEQRDGDERRTHAPIAALQPFLCIDSAHGGEHTTRVLVRAHRALHLHPHFDHVQRSAYERASHTCSCARHERAQGDASPWRWRGRCVAVRRLRHQTQLFDWTW
mmetsp:Transcript_4261/g.9575  ORF Transcript_4261/g.9575 Transcript_4261/m.9575 type:complete len:222 (-) Transcript_4261:11-676(-)